MKYFCVSDIHGHYKALKRSLKKAGFDKENPEHKIIMIGDMVDRGPHSKEVLEYFYKMQKKDKAICIMGNHDYFLLQFMKYDFSRTKFNMEYNGHKTTIESLLGRKIKKKKSLFKEYADELNEKYPHIFAFLHRLKYYHEIDKYIFVHGGFDGRKENWKEEEPYNMIWNRQFQLPPIPNRITVVGHTQAVYVRDRKANKKKLLKTNPEMFDILDQGNVIHIDGSVNTTKKVNVLVLDL